MARLQAGSTGGRLRRFGLVAQSCLYVVAGVNHFWHSHAYMHIMPPHYAHPLRWVWLTGAAEIAGGLGLLPRRTRRAAAWGLVAMLVVYLEVHVFMALHPQRFAPIPRWALFLRIPLQVPLMYWAWSCTRPPRTPERLRR